MSENISIRNSNALIILNRNRFFLFRISITIFLQIKSLLTWPWSYSGISGHQLCTFKTYLLVPYFLCLVSWEGSQVTGWYLPPWFWLSLQMILAHNIDCNMAPRTCLANCGNRCKFTPNLVSSHCSGSQAWTDLGLQCRQRVSQLSKPWLTPCFPRAGTFLCTRHSRISGCKLFFECWSYFKLQTLYNYQQLIS